MESLFKIGFLDVKWIDILDICIVAFLIYRLYKLLKGSVALKIFVGFLGIYFFYLIVKAAKMELISTILGNVMGIAFIAIIIIFQQEIRKFLLISVKTASVKNKNLLQKFVFSKSNDTENLDISPLIEAAKILGGTNTGALIVIAKESQMRLYTDTGDDIEAYISKRLFLSIFNKFSPLHDGAVIIVNNRIKAARCILPISDNPDLPAFLGLRHRAAIGITEMTESIVLVVSEETGEISIARDGKLYYNLSAIEVRNKLNLYLFGKEEDILKEVEQSLDVISVSNSESISPTLSK
ncbi:MAG: TIGR00159 family protein [Cytophagales bacterium]|nr:MAG: TIGR00159 family protein [Cytophagales bacterium]